LGLPCPAMYASVNADRGADMTGGLTVENWSRQTDGGKFSFLIENLMWQRH
jgi:hypothetical protein